VQRPGSNYNYLPHTHVTESHEPTNELTLQENIYSEVLCSLIAYLYYVAIASSLYNLVAIAVNRYIGIVLASRYIHNYCYCRIIIFRITVSLLIPSAITTRYILSKTLQNLLYFFLYFVHNIEI